ncbi:DUF4846 domain-containing protein [Chitinophaga horti]|uniref:DUF4846 domain-containing protein n=1 Tax=Chitinophaga horti TaxID=2920382 RepID=A0ABY6J7M3_9BACT|nr:DUF4846 domain-containing protein [Chitinophaga horti]UYQ94582.1 DUF4846 domain-containing protein [Chitinophaga horti]
MTRHLLFLSLLMLSVAPSFAQTTGNIPLPAGFSRLSAEAGSFAAFLRKVPLKADKTVYLYNGQRKANQQAQFAVLDVSVGNKDLQQCADAVMRLYAEYHYAAGEYRKIAFEATDGTLLDYASWRDGYRYKLRGSRLQKVKSATPSTSRASFGAFLDVVFSYAGTLSLSRELARVSNQQDIRPGDVVLQGGSPGHAVIVMDVAVNGAGEKRFLLAQSYMPAQSIHILNNPSAASPWYQAAWGASLATPEWTFGRDCLYRWR